MAKIKLGLELEKFPTECMETKVDGKRRWQATFNGSSTKQSYVGVDCNMWCLSIGEVGINFALHLSLGCCKLMGTHL